MSQLFSLEEIEKLQFVIYQIDIFIIINSIYLYFKRISELSIEILNLMFY